jgi:hypothetical protein
MVDEIDAEWDGSSSISGATHEIEDVIKLELLTSKKDYGNVGHAQL